MSPTDLANLFVYHPPSPSRATIHEHVRQMCFALASEIAHVVPEGQEKDYAIDCIRMAMMWSNAAIACQAPDPEPGDGS